MKFVYKLESLNKLKKYFLPKKLIWNEPKLTNLTLNKHKNRKRKKHPLYLKKR